MVYYGCMKYLDAHCHILSAEKIHDTCSHGVGALIVNATQPAQWETVAELARKDTCVYGAIGVHPWYVADLPDGWDFELINALATNPDLMVGEIGLDKNRPDFETQESVFCRQLQIAHDLSRVAHIHCVGAWGRMMDILRGVELPLAMVLHAFSGSPELVRELAGLGAYFSFGNAIVDKKHAKMRAAVAVVPENRILVESDAPDCAMPDAISDTIAEIAHLRGKGVAEMANTIYENTMGLLNDRQI